MPLRSWLQLHRWRQIPLLVPLGLCGLALGAEPSYQWSMTPVIGVHEPVIKRLNEVALKTHTYGYGTVCPSGDCAADAGAYTSFFDFYNPLADIGLNTNVGLEFEWFQTSKGSFLMGASTWEGSTRGTVPGQMPLQGRAPQDVVYQRTVNLSYNEFYFGWKQRFVHNPGKYSFYGRISLNEFFDIDYRDNHVFTFSEGDLADVKRIAIYNGQTTGVLMSHLGIGGEYFLKKNISVGFEAGYLFSERPFQFTNAQNERNFDDLADHVTPLLPVRPIAAGAPLSVQPLDARPPYLVTCTPEQEAAQQCRPGDVATPPLDEFKLRFDGWKAAFRITIYY